MARPYGQKFLMEVFAHERPTLGIELARLCVKANLNTSHVAEALEVSRATVHSWFRGATINKSRHELVLAFIKLLTKDSEEGVLPVSTPKDSKSYIESMLGRTI